MRSLTSRQLLASYGIEIKHPANEARAAQRLVKRLGLPLKQYRSGRWTQTGGSQNTTLNEMEQDK